MVYLVDDDIDDLEILQEALVHNNYYGPVKTVLNGKMLMDELFESKKPEVIVLDLNMPLKNGFEVLRELKSSPELKGIPVIVLTASTNATDRAKCVNLGCNFFFNKPDSLTGYDRIAAEVKKYTGRHRENPRS